MIFQIQKKNASNRANLPMPQYQSQKMDMINSVLDSIDEDFKNFAPLTFLKNLTSLKPSFIVLPLIVLTLFLAVVAPSVASPLVTLITIVYPGYMTFEAIHYRREQECKKWMVFWIIFSFLNVFNGLLRTLLFFVPAFSAFKFLFLLWLFYPRTDGASIIYEKVFKPYSAQIRNAAKRLAAGH